ncbi:hypothetical protein GEMRC1_011669 [Eukaryota sp. GEM-RC1]
MDRGAVDLLFKTATSCIFLFFLEKVRPEILHPPFGTTRLGGVSLKNLFTSKIDNSKKQCFTCLQVCSVTDGQLQEDLDQWFVNCNSIVPFPLDWDGHDAEVLKESNEDSEIVNNFKKVLEKAWCLRHLLMMPSSWSDVDLMIPMKNNNGKIGMLKCQVKSHAFGMMSSCVEFQVAGIPSISVGCSRKPVPSSWLKSTSLKEQLGLQEVNNMDYHQVFLLNSFHLTHLESIFNKAYTPHNVYENVSLFNCLD